MRQRAPRRILTTDPNMALLASAANTSLGIGSEPTSLGSALVLSLLPLLHLLGPFQPLCLLVSLASQASGPAPGLTAGRVCPPSGPPVSHAVRRGYA